MKDSFSFYKDQGILCLVAIPLGIVIGAVCALFGIVLLKITDFRTVHYLFLLPFLGVVGVLIVFCYQKFGADSAKGMGLLYETYQQNRKDIPIRIVPMVMVSTWLTHLFGGSAGREGVAVQIGGAVGCYAGNKLPVKDARRILMIAGMAAGFGGLFRTPLAAAFFAIEVLSVGALEYRAIAPSVVAAFAACHVSGRLGLGKFTFALTSSAELSFETGLKLVVLGLAFGLAGMLFAVLLKVLKKKFTELLKNPLTRIMVIGTAVGLVSLICLGGRYSGLGTNLISEGFTGDILPWDFIVKLLFTVVTLAAGYFGGEVTPLFSIGVSLGFVMASLLGLPTELCAALGYAAVFGSATNTLIAPILIGAEVFGMDYLPMFVIVCVVGFMCNGNHSIYSLQKTSVSDILAE